MRILLLISITLFYISCKTPAISTATNTEILQYKLENIDTLVDIGCGDAFHDKLISKVYPNVFFVLEDLPFYTLYTKKQSSTLHLKVDTKNKVKKTFRNSSNFPSIESRYTLIIGSEDSIPLPSASSKRILCRRTLHEFKSKEKMILELIRIMHPDAVLTIVEAEPKYPGEIEEYCRHPYMTKSDVINSLKMLKLKDESTVMYDERKLNILNFTK